MFKIGLVLSGGGARCIAHLGVLQALEELGLRPGAVAGASAGAVLAALYAAGLPPTEILAAVKKNGGSGLINHIAPGTSLFTQGGLAQFFKDTGLPAYFEALAMPLWISATDLKTCKPVIFSAGRLHLPLIGSCAVPGVFMPIPFAGYELADGGLLNNLPADDIRKVCEILIGCHVNKLHKAVCRKMSRLQLLDRSFHLAIEQQVAQSAAFCDYYLEPELNRFPMFEIKDPGRLFQAGYQTVMRQAHQLQRTANGHF